MDPASATTALQRGTIDCVHGDPQWLEGFGYMDVSKSVFLHPMGIGGPAMALYLSRKTWLSLTPDEKKAVVRGAALASALQAINTFILEGERVLDEAKKKGIALNPGSKEVDDVIAAFAPKQRAINIENAKKFGVKNAEAIMASYLKAQEKWKVLSKDIGRDVNKMRDASDARGLRQDRLREVLKRNEPGPPDSAPAAPVLQNSPEAKLRHELTCVGSYAPGGRA